MSKTKRYSAGMLAIGTVVGSLALAPAATAGVVPVDDSVTVTTNTTPHEITVFPQGSSLIGPALVEVETAVVDAGDVLAVLDTVALLAQITGPFG